MATTSDRFLYQAHAVGFSGRIRRPFEEIIEAQASSALPSSGGFVRSSVRNFNHKGLMKFDAAYTVITGSEVEDGFDTLISATVENLNILDQVTAVRVVAHMTSHHGRGDDQPVITPMGSHYEGLRIAGQAVELDLNAQLFFKEQNYDGLCRDLNQQPANTPLLTSLITELPDIPGVTRSRNTYRIPRFGAVHLAEFVYSPLARRVIMIRFEMGCPVEAEATVSEIDGNGSPIPPTS